MNVLPRYQLLLRRWFWLLALSTIVGAGFALAVGWFWPAYQSAEAFVRIRFNEGLIEESSDAERQKVRILNLYADYLTSSGVLEQVRDRGDTGLSPEQIRRRLEVTTLPRSRQLRIFSTNPRGADAIALVNGLAGLLHQAPATEIDESDLSLFGRSQQVERLRQDIAETEAAIEALEIELASAESGPETAADGDGELLEAMRLTTLYRRLDAANSALTEILQLLPTADQLIFVEEVIPAQEAEPVRRALLPITLWGALLGFALSLLVVLVPSILLNRIESLADLERAVPAPILGSIVRHKKPKEILRGYVTVSAMPNSQAAQDYRALGAKLRWSKLLERGTAAVMITTASDPDEMGDVAANLAIVMSQTGRKVVLIDANPYRSSLSFIFGSAGEHNLATYLDGSASWSDLEPIEWAPSLYVLPSYPLLSSIFETFASPAMADLIDGAKRRADLVLVLAPPIHAHAETLVLAAHCDATVLVANCGLSRRDLLSSAAETLLGIHAPLLGTVLYNADEPTIPVESDPSLTPILTDKHRVEANGAKEKSSLEPA